MVLRNVFNPGLIKLNLESEDKAEVFAELVELYVSKNSSASRSLILTALNSRELKLSTGVKPGVALPHAQSDQVSGVKGIIGVSRSGIDYDALDGKPVHVIFLLLSSPDGCANYLRALKRLSLLLDNPDFFQNLIAQKNSDGVYDTICRFEDMLATSM